MVIHPLTKILGTIAAIVVLFYGYTEYIKKPRETAPAKLTADEEEKRFKEWAYVAQDKEIRPGERIKLVIVPSPLGEYFDTRCLVYTNDAFKQSSMVCPGADKEFLKEEN